MFDGIECWTSKKQRIHEIRMLIYIYIYIYGKLKIPEKEGFEMRKFA